MPSFPILNLDASENSKTMLYIATNKGRILKAVKETENNARRVAIYENSMARTFQLSQKTCNFSD